MEKTLINELTRGMELTEQLKTQFDTFASPESCELLIRKIISSYDKALSVLNLGDSVDQVLAGRSQSTEDSEPSLKDQYCSNVYKKRKTLPQWTKEVKLCSETGQGSLDDGFSWRKYGQKVILGANFPRAYYRCTHQHGRGCLARKHVQRSDEDPSIFKVIYRGRHTCNQTRQVTPSSTSSGIEFPEQMSGPSSRPIFDGENSGQSQDLFFNYETALALKTEEMNPSFSFPCSLIQPDNMESNVFAEFLKENDFISAEPSESAFYRVLPDQMDDFRLGQNWQHSESDGNETISAPGSVTNSPMGNLDFTLDQVDFDPNFPFDTCELFS
ncbi:probable WRKY transcription factor 46 [Diospyros lotus]|uniref:probable WRKY transcription factor 46 n=1 Tax=Diospyros lotus TaxID=55363 RepID=UPI00225C09ED|nr:probable WRKY transcription factor 46 [Diospyros lotus]